MNEEWATRRPTKDRRIGEKETGLELPGPTTQEIAELYSRLLNHCIRLATFC